MLLKVKNSKMLIIYTAVVTVFFAIVYFQKYSIARQTHSNNFGESYEAIVRDSLMRLSYSLKSSLDSIDVSRDITIIGIDDETTDLYGKTTSPYWQLRVPYNACLKYLQRYFTPSALSIDIIFKRDISRLQTGVSEDPEVLLSLSKEIKTFSETFEEMKPKSLLNLSTLISELGEINFSSTFALLQDPFGLDLPKVPVITAYNLEEPQTLYTKRDIDFTDRHFYKWSEKEVLGDDPQDLSEDLGSAIPYLKKVSIPEESISGTPEDFVYLPYASLISKNFIDYVSPGFINVLRDADGIVRRVPLVLATRYFNSAEKKLKTVFLPSLSLLSCLTHWGVKPADLKIEFGKYIEVKTKAGIKKIPIDKYGRIMANFNFRPKDMNYVPFSRVNEFGAGLSKQGREAFQGKFKESLDYVEGSLKGKIALLGLTHTANGDTGPTAIDSNLAFVYVHGAAINSMLKDEYLLPAGDVQIILIMLAVFAILTAGSVMMSISGFTLLFFLAEVCILCVSLAGIYYSWMYLPTLFLLIYSFVFYILAVLYRYFSEEKEKYKIRNMFSTMVSSSVLDYMESNPDSFRLTGSRMSATMMFSDVAGFTSISEGLPPEKLVLLLNKYLSPMTDIIQDSGGYVDKYEGDAIMAEWGVPFKNERHATLACFASLDQQKKLDEIREELYEEFGYRLTVRIGLNSGEVSAGNMGSHKRFSYTVMGDAVNLAARLEPTNKVYGTFIMIGENTYDLAKDDIEARLLDKVVVVGKKEAIRVYELLARKGGLSEEQKTLVRHYEKGLALHEDRKWEEALAEFNKALEAVPDDQASKVLIERITEYKEHPPGPEWQGEYVRKSKD